MVVIRNMKSIRLLSTMEMEMEILAPVAGRYKSKNIFGNWAKLKSIAKCFLLGRHIINNLGCLFMSNRPVPFETSPAVFNCRSDLSTL